MENQKNQDVGFKGVLGSIFIDIQNGIGNKIRTYILFDLSLAILKKQVPPNRQALIFMIFETNGNVTDLLKPLSLTLKLPHFPIKSRTNQIDIWTCYIFSLDIDVRNT